MIELGDGAAVGMFSAHSLPRITFSYGRRLDDFSVTTDSYFEQDQFT